MKQEFEAYLRGVLSSKDFEEGLRELFGSAHRRTKVLRDCSILSHAELLELADLLNVSPMFLIQEFGAAAGLTEREVNNLRAVQEAATI
jgi:hypothetical protein